VRVGVTAEPPGFDRYDRQLLLLGARRNAVVELHEVLRFGEDSFGDPNYVSIYGLRPEEWYARGIRLLGRTVVECTPDHVAEEIADDITHTVNTLASGHGRGMVVIDPFAGSANTLYWILRGLPAASGVGFELDAEVYRLTRQNLAIVGSSVEYVHDDYQNALQNLTVAEDALVVAFVAPPWGTAFDPVSGLDLARTSPPVRIVVDALAQRFANPMLFAVQVCERLVPESLTSVTTGWEWSALHIFGSSKAAGNRNGLLLLSRGAGALSANG